MQKQISRCDLYRNTSHNEDFKKICHLYVVKPMIIYFMYTFKHLNDISF